MGGREFFPDNDGSDTGDPISGLAAETIPAMT